MQANAAIRFERPAENHHSYNAVNRSEHVNKMVGLKHGCHPGGPIILQVCDLDHINVVAASQNVVAALFAPIDLRE